MMLCTLADLKTYLGISDNTQDALLTMLIKQNSAIFVAIGGTSSTAIKVQHCDTNNGTFTDFATLVSADDAGTSTDVGIALDISGAKKFIKMTGATKASVILGDASFDPSAE